MIDLCASIVIMRAELQTENYNATFCLLRACGRNTHTHTHTHTHHHHHHKHHTTYTGTRTEPTVFVLYVMQVYLMSRMGHECVNTQDCHSDLSGRGNRTWTSCGRPLLESKSPLCLDRPAKRRHQTTVVES